MTPTDVWLYFTRPAIILAGIVLLFMVPKAVRAVRLGLNRRKFSCLMCGNCCHFGVIEITGDDVREIGSRGYGGFYERDGKMLKLKKVGGKCVFFEDGLCSIHGFKPKVCSDFPFFTFLGVPYARGILTCAGVRKLERDLRGK